MADKVDITKLDPQTVARHLANPEGDVGVAITAGLNKTNEGPYRLARATLAVQAGDHILEVGFGNGHEIAQMLTSAACVRYTGIDASATMVAEAGLRNADAIRDGRVALHFGSSAALPFEPDSFDKALALNTIYFWQDPAVDLAELRRVLRRDGRLVLGAIAPWSATRPIFKYGFKFYSVEDLTALLNRCGFDHVSNETLVDETVAVSGERMTRDYFIVAAE